MAQVLDADLEVLRDLSRRGGRHLDVDVDLQVRALRPVPRDLLRQPVRRRLQLGASLLIVEGEQRAVVGMREAQQRPRRQLARVELAAVVEEMLEVDLALELAVLAEVKEAGHALRDDALEGSGDAVRELRPDRLLELLDGLLARLVDAPGRGLDLV